MSDTKNISLSWKLNANDNNHKEYIEILRRYKDYGFSTMTKLVAAALEEYSVNHKDSLAKGAMIESTTDYRSII